jgi:hypothetical protein
MPGIPSPFGGADDHFGRYDAFEADRLPEPGPFLDGHDVLTGAPHAAFHRLTRALFEARAVYDVTFDYNLARLNLDERHAEAGYRYAVERPDAADALVGEGADRVLRAEFTPTTEFCPQTTTLTVGAFRAWNGLAERHEYDLVRVRVAPSHQQADAVNDRLAALEREFLAAGELPEPEDRPEAPAGADAVGGDATDAPF